METLSLLKVLIWDFLWLLEQGTETLREYPLRQPLIGKQMQYIRTYTWLTFSSFSSCSFFFVNLSFIWVKSEFTDSIPIVMFYKENHMFAYVHNQTFTFNMMQYVFT